MRSATNTAARTFWKVKLNMDVAIVAVVGLVELFILIGYRLLSDVMFIQLWLPEISDT